MLGALEKKGGKGARWTPSSLRVKMDADMGLGHKADIYQRCHAHCSS